MIKNKSFNVLAVFVIGFAALLGAVFPFFMLLFPYVDKETVLNIWFIITSIIIGIIIGVSNVFISKKIIGTKLKDLSRHMAKVEKHLLNRSASDDMTDCFASGCYIDLRSNDEIGECANAFNSLIDALQKTFSTGESVKRISEMLSSKFELDKIANDALTSLLDNMNALAGAIVIEKEGELRLLSSKGINEPESLVENHTVWQVFENKRGVCLELPEDILLNGVLLNFRPKHVLTEPIIFNDVVLGVIVIAGTEVLLTDGKSNIDLYSQGLWLALKNAIKHDQLQQLAALAANDPLTGVLNRRFGILRLQEGFSRALRTSQSLGLLIIDIDRFKKVNDTYGHLIGDKVLIEMTEITKSALRQGDVFFRYGGEEFTVVLPGASKDDIYKIAERIRQYIERATFVYDSHNIKITVSIGGTSFPSDSIESFDHLIQTADKNLYLAKEKGRNSVVIK